VIGYVVRRIGQLVPVAMVVTMMVFSMLILLPGDPAVAVLGEHSSPEQRAALRAEMRLDDPLPMQYVRWLWGIANGDLGRSLRTTEPVSAMLAARVPVTLQLTLSAMLLAVAIGVPLGVAAAVRRNTWLDVVVGVVAMSSMAMPFFWVAILLILLFAVHLAWLPPSGYVPFFADPVENLRLMILPAITIGSAMAALVMRQTRTSMLQVLSEDYVRTARAKGASEGAVLLRHALRNALIPVVTIIGLQTGALVGGAVVTETVFAIPGLGRMIVDGIFERDFPAVQGGILVVVALVLVVNLLTDIAYARVDRRIKL
jgi:peptide/nickel transport system permease protein